MVVKNLIDLFALMKTSIPFYSIIKQVTSLAFIVLHCLMNFYFRESDI